MVCLPRGNQNDGDYDDDDDFSTKMKSSISDSGQPNSGQWSSKREQLKAKLQAYQGMLRVAKTQGIARKLDADYDAGRQAKDREEEEVQIHPGASKAELEISSKPLSSMPHSTSSQSPSKPQVDASTKGSVPPQGASERSGSRTPGNDSMTQHAGVFPRSDEDFDYTQNTGGTKSSAAKIGATSTPLKVVSANGPQANHTASSSGCEDEDDEKVLAEDRLRLAYSYVNIFVVMMCGVAVFSFVFGVFMPWGFSIWSIAMPLSLASGYLMRHREQLLPVKANNMMPQSLAWVTMIIVYTASFLFLSGILAASASLSIAPLIGSPVCTGYSIFYVSISPDGYLNIKHLTDEKIRMTDIRAFSAIHSLQMH